MAKFGSIGKGMKNSNNFLARKGADPGGSGGKNVMDASKGDRKFMKMQGSKTTKKSTRS